MSDEHLQNVYHDDRVQLRLGPRPASTSTTEYTYTTNANVFHYRRRRPVNNYRRRNDYFLFGKREPLLPLRPARTTTSATSTTTSNPSENDGSEGITPWMTRVHACLCCMKCFPCVLRARFVRLSCSSVASSPTRGNPVTGSPHLSSRLTRSRHLSFCTGLSTSYRNRDVALHHFRIVAVAPFLSTTVTNTSYLLHVNF